MRGILSLVAGAVLLTVGTAQAASREKSEARIARALKGRVAGAPVDCIFLHNVRSSRIYDKTAILFDAGSTIYVNRPENSAESLRDSDTLVMKPTDSRLCKVDIVRTWDSSSRMHSGSVFLGKFVPYRKAAAGYSD